jgi:UDP-N-acetyl-D-mannosaminuronic acid dehydrogenase
MGYVGLTLAAAMAKKGYIIYGVDVQPKVLASLKQGKPHIFEPGIDEIYATMTGKSIFIDTTLPEGGVDAAILCVSTPVLDGSHEPYLENLRKASQMIVEKCSPDTLVVVRSTVPVGTSRRLVLSELEAGWGKGNVRLVMAPERTIQGQALKELVDLPQVVGGLDERSQQDGLALFGGLAKQLVPVSSIEAAELVKLSNNCHTDLIYSFGNEIAMIAERFGLDPLEVIRATNIDYPRPDLAKPGYVGGGCLSKDPYILINAAESRGYTPFLVGKARELNEFLPVHVAEQMVKFIRESRGSTEGATISVLGWAYKGWPPTDDMRGTPIAAMMPIFRAAGLNVKGHDPMVTNDTIKEYGGNPVSIEEAFSDTDAVLIIINHPDYAKLDVGKLINGGKRPSVLFDSWRILDGNKVRDLGVKYAGIGYV